MTYLLSLDLEMCQPSGVICEIGVSIGELETRKIIDTKSFLVNPNEEISPFITTLTGITNEMVKDAPDLLGAYRDLVAYAKHWNPHKQCIQWGGGDDYTLRKQLGDLIHPDEWIMGRTSMNVKTLVQAIRTARGEKTQGGLKKMCNVFNVKVEGPMHRAHNDARATMQIYFKLLDMLRDAKV